GDSGDFEFDSSAAVEGAAVGGDAPGAAGGVAVCSRAGAGGGVDAGTAAGAGAGGGGAFVSAASGAAGGAAGWAASVLGVTSASTGLGGTKGAANKTTTSELPPPVPSATGGASGVPANQAQPIRPRKRRASAVAVAA